MGWWKTLYLGLFTLALPSRRLLSSGNLSSHVLVCQLEMVRTSVERVTHTIREHTAKLAEIIRDFLTPAQGASKLHSQAQIRPPPDFV